MSTFHPFPRLPLELRLAIWEMTVEPREVEVGIFQPTPEDPLEALYAHPSKWEIITSEKFNEAMRDVPTSTHAGRKTRKKAREDWKPYRPYVHLVSSTIPATMHACREARNHGLYERVFMEVDEQHGTDRRYVWLNLNIDLINIGKTGLAYFVPMANCIKRLKFSREVTDEYWCDYEGRQQLPKFTNVEEIHVVCLDGFWNWGNEADNFLWPCPLENIVFIDETSPENHLRAGHLEMERIRCKMLGISSPSSEEESLDW
jgi:hypothetical protein